MRVLTPKMRENIENSYDYRCGLAILLITAQEIVEKDLSNLGRQNLNSARKLINNHAEQDVVKNMVDLIITTTDVVAIS